MKLGAFSISLAVKDIQKSKDFYESLGFTKLGGNIDQKWLILKNEKSIIGLFEGMFEKNIITFNPGWDENAQNIEEFDDVRIIQQHLKNCGLQLTSEANENTIGPAHITLTDPNFHFQFSIFNFQFSIFNFQFSILNSQFSILNSQFSILNKIIIPHFQ